MTLKLSYPVHTLDGKLLMPAGSLLTPDRLEELIATNSVNPEKSYMLKYGSVKDDMFMLFSEVPAYRHIFMEPNNTRRILELMKAVELPLPILESLDYFKAKDSYTYRHILMVFALSTLLSEMLVKNTDELAKNILATPTHDFGKICVPLDVLTKTTPLTRTEQHMLRHHTLAGYVLLTYYFRDRNNFSARVARDHHEKRNGMGYPDGLHLRDKMVEIVVISDIYDALISKRPYRLISYDNRTALEEITEMAMRDEIGWDTLKALVAVNRKKLIHYKECQVSTEKRGIPPNFNAYGIIADNE